VANKQRSGARTAPLRALLNDPARIRSEARALPPLPLLFVEALGREVDALVATARISDKQKQVLLADAKLLLPLHVLGVLKAVDPRPEKQEQALRALLDALDTAWSLALQFQAAGARDQTLKSIARAREAKRGPSQTVDDAIARLAGAHLQRHPKQTSHRVANEIEKPLNELLGVHRIKPLTADAIRKRVEKYRLRVGR